MSSIVIAGDTSGSVTLQAPAVSGTTVLTLPSTSGTLSTSASQWTTSGSNIYYTTGAVLAGLSTASNATGVGAIQVGPTGMGAASTDGGLEFTSNSGAGGYGGKIWASNTLDALVISGRNASATWTNLLTLRPNVTVALEGASGSTGTGIAFPATQNPSSNANTLDDYEEGTWTPIDSSGAGLSLSVYSARYTKIGRMVECFAQITYPTTANTSQAIIGGLPFTNASTTGGSYGAFTAYSSYSAVINWLNSSANTISVAYGLGATAITNANLSTNNLRLVWIYEV